MRGTGALFWTGGGGIQRVPTVPQTPFPAKAPFRQPFSENRGVCAVHICIHMHIHVCNTCTKCVACMQVYIHTRVCVVWSYHSSYTAEQALALCQPPAMCSRGSFFPHPSKPRTGGLGLGAASACVHVCAHVCVCCQSRPGYSHPSASSQLSPPWFSISSSHQSRLQGRMSGFCASKRYLVTGWRLVTNLFYLWSLLILLLGDSVGF